MNEDFVTYEVAKKLKEKGFKFNKDYRLDRFFMANEINTPTIAQVLKWLREEKGIVVWMKPNHKKTGWTWLSTVQKSYCKYEIGNPFTQHGFFDSYESAALAGIEYVLDNLI